MPKSKKKVAPEWSDAEIELLKMLDKKGVRYADRVKYFTGRTQDAIRNKTWEVRQMEANSWLEDQRVGFLDIETTNLKANFGVMLSWCLKLRGGKILEDCVTRKEIIDRELLDRRIAQSLVDTLRDDVDVIVTYNGVRFDIPYIRSRCLMLGIDFLPYGSKKHIDMYYQVRGKLRLHRSSLDAACEALHIKGKTPISPQVWRDAALGYPDALKKVLRHNRGDVRILEKLFEKLLPFARSTRRSI